LHRRHGRVGRHHDTVGPDHDLTVEIGRYWSCSLRRPATPAAMSTTKTAVQTTFPVPPGRGRRAACADQPGPRTEMTDGPHLVNEVGAVDCFSRGAGQLVAGAAPPPLAGPPPVEPPPKPPEDGGSESPGPASPAGATLAATSSRSSSSSASGRGEPENVNLASSVLSDSPSQPSTSTETSSPAATSPKRIFSDSWSSISRWIVRRSGRAPSTGSKPRLASRCLALSVTSTSMSLVLSAVRT